MLSDSDVMRDASNGDKETEKLLSDLRAIADISGGRAGRNRR
jgi:hypothetical protein